jgi:hypothetical protein
MIFASTPRHFIHYISMIDDVLHLRERRQGKQPIGYILRKVQAAFCISHRQRRASSHLLPIHDDPVSIGL